MKKFIVLLVSLVYFFSANMALALNELYYLNNVSRETLAPQVEMLLSEKIIR